MELTFHREASAELQEAADWYEAQAGIGEELLAEVDRATEAIRESPMSWAVWTDVHARHEVRRFVLPRFPFTLPYVVEKERVVILAVAHTSRRPHYWAQRI